MKKDNFRWMLMIGVALIALATSANTLAFAPMLGDIAKDVGISVPAAQASFLGIFVFVVAISCLISGTLADRFGVMPILILAITGAVVPNLLYPMVGNNLSVIVFFRVLQGYGAGAVFSLIPIVSGAWFSEKEKGMTVGLGMTGVNAGMMVGIAGAPMINEITKNWRSTMTVFGYMNLVLLIYAIFLATQFKKHTPMNHNAHGNEDKNAGSEIKVALTNPSTWLGIVMCMFISWLLNALNDLIPQYFALSVPMGVGFGSVVAGKLMLLVQIGTVIGSLFVGILIDKVFKGNAKPVLAIGFGVTAVLVLTILSSAVYNNSALLMLVLFLAGTFVAFLNPTASIIVAQSYPEHVVGRIAGLWLGVGAFGGSLGVFVGAIALHYTGTYTLTIILFAVASVIGIILSRLIRMKKVSVPNSVSVE